MSEKGKKLMQYTDLDNLTYNPNGYLREIHTDKLDEIKQDVAYDNAVANGAFGQNTPTFRKNVSSKAYKQLQDYEQKNTIPYRSKARKTLQCKGCHCSNCLYWDGDKQDEWGVCLTQSYIDKPVDIIEEYDAELLVSHRQDTFSRPEDWELVGKRWDNCCADWRAE